MRDFSIIVAMDKNRGIGKAGGLPWHLPQDMKHFKQITADSAVGKINAVVMGRKTWESIPERFRPLPGRLNIVLTRDPEFALAQTETCFRFLQMDQAFEMLNTRDDIGDVFVIGGASLYHQTIRLPECRYLYVTQIHHAFDCDVFFPEIPGDFSRSFHGGEFIENTLSFSFLKYQKIT